MVLVVGGVRIIGRVFGWCQGCVRVVWAWLASACDSNRRMVAGMADTTFPDDLLTAQTRLHQAWAEHAAFCRTLPWSVEPMPGWPGEAHPHTGVVTGGREDSPGWTEQQKQDEARLRAECLDLSIAVTVHPYWETVERDKLVAARMLLKQVTQPAATPVVDVTQAA